MEINIDDMTVSYEESEAIKNDVFKKVMDYFKEHEVFSGESILQMDEPVIEAPHVMADIADNIIKFECRYK